MGASVWEGSVIFSFPRVSTTGLTTVIQMGVVVFLGGEISGEKILQVLVTLLDPTMFVMSAVSSIHESCLIPW